MTRAPRRTFSLRRRRRRRRRRKEEGGRTGRRKLPLEVDREGREKGVKREGMRRRRKGRRRKRRREGREEMAHAWQKTNRRDHLQRKMPAASNRPLPRRKRWATAGREGGREGGREK